MFECIVRALRAIAQGPFLVSRHGRDHWLFPDGRTLPAVRGGDGPETLDDLTAERGRVFARMEDLVNTAKQAERAMSDDEQTEYTACRSSFDDLTKRMNAAAAQANTDVLAADLEARRSFAVPMINRLGDTDKPSAGRSLDELLWATADSVPAGSFDKTGHFHQHFSARNAVEQVVVRGADDSGVYAPRVDEFRPEHRSMVRSFQNLVADMALFGLMVDKKAKNSADGFQAARSHRAFKDRWLNALRAMDVDTSGEGGAWVPTGIGASLHEKVRAAGKVAPLFPRIDLPTNPWKWPLEGADPAVYRVAEPTADNESKPSASTPGTVAATFDAEIFGGRLLFSRSLEADSVLAILPFARMKLVKAFVEAEEKAILDGDADGTHQDTDVHALGTTDPRWAWDGLRKKAIAQTVVTATTTTAANLIAIRGGMGKWGVNPADLAYIVGVSALLDLIGDTNLLTVDKMGPQATILNGMIGSVGGVPVIVSEHVRENLNASGVHDAITTTKTYNLCVNRGEFALGQRMALDVEVDDSIYRETFQRVMVAFMREDFQHIGDAAANDDVAIAYNVTP